MLDDIDSTNFKFPSNGAGDVTKTTLFFCLEDLVSISGVKSFNEAETGLVVGFLGGAILCSSSAKTGLDGGDVEGFS